jgi:hypothetical protein
MLQFFRKKKGNVEVNGFSAAVEKKKLKIASWLDRKTTGWSPAFMKTALVIFCILFGGFCFYILSQSIRKRDIRSHIIVLNHLRSGVQSSHYPPVSDSLFRNALRMKQWLDSLRQNDTVKLRAILLAKPFLLTNLQLIETIYQSQKH